MRAAAYLASLDEDDDDDDESCLESHRRNSELTSNNCMLFSLPVVWPSPCPPSLPSSGPSVCSHARHLCAEAGQSPPPPKESLDAVVNLSAASWEHLVVGHHHKNNNSRPPVRSPCLHYCHRCRCRRYKGHSVGGGQSRGGPGPHRCHPAGHPLLSLCTDDALWPDTIWPSGPFERDCRRTDPSIGCH